MVKMGTVWDRTAEFLTDNLTAIVPIALLAFFVPFSIQGNFAHIRDGANPGFALTLQLVSLAFGLAARSVTRARSRRASCCPLC
jgi:hypothetical protein